MSDVALDYYKSLARKRTGPDGKPLSPAELRLLKQLCYRHNTAVWCSFECLRDTAEAAQLSMSHCRRVLAGLERRKMARRYASVNARANASTSNEVELPDLLRWLVQEGQLRADQVRPLLRKKRAIGVRMEFFREIRVRVRVTSPQAIGQGVRRMSAEPAGGQGVLKMSAEPHEGGQGVVRISAEVAVKDVEEAPQLAFSAVERVGPPTQNEWPPHSKKSPSSTKREVQEGKYATPSSPFVAAEMCKSNRNDNGKGERRWSGLGDSDGSGVPGALRAVQRVARPVEEREGLDGVDAALWDEAMAVLAFAGVAPGNATRRQRDAVRRALELYCCEQECAPAAAGDHARGMWDLFLAGASFMLQAKRPDLRRFYAEGYWLNPKRWPWMIHELRTAQMVRQSDGSVLLSLGSGRMIDSRHVM